MADNCVPQIAACRARFTRLDTDGTPNTVVGTDVFVTKSFSQFNTTAVYVDGEEIEDKNACGEIEVNFKQPDSFKRIDWEFTLMVPDPYLVAGLIDGGVLVAGDAVGFSYPAIGSVSEDNIWSIELWSKRVKNGRLDPDFPYGWWALPQAQNIRIGDRAFASGTQLTVISGQAVENENWGTGPGSPSWPDTSDRVIQMIPTTELPDVNCGTVVGS